MISIFYDDAGTLRREFLKPQPTPPKETPMLCEGCKQTVQCVYVDPPSGKRFCDSCWRSPAMIALRKEAGYNSDGSKTIITIPPSCTCKASRHMSHLSYCPLFPSNPMNQPSQSKLEKCTSCLNVSNDVTMVEGIGLICESCLEYTEASAQTMHIRLKIKSSPRTIALFHFVMSALDTDWPWAGRPINCEHCGGARYKSPIYEPKDIKLIAELCHIGKLKISYIGEASKCEEKPTILSDQTAADMQTILNGGLV